MALHRSFSFLVVALLLPWCVVGQVASELRPQPDPNKPLATVEASCGECNFDLPGLGCDLAVRLPEGSFYVDGVDVKEFGHPHDANGFCLAVRRAEVQGEVVDGRYKASYFKLLPVETEKRTDKE